MSKSLTRYLLPHLFRILCPPPFLPLLALHPRPGTAASPPPREDGARLCLAVYRGSSEGGKGRWFGDRPSLKHPKATNTTLQPIPPPLSSREVCYGDPRSAGLWATSHQPSAPASRGGAQTGSECWQLSRGAERIQSASRGARHAGGI